ncbi:MAG: hypothetical protein A2W07_04250 [candidate division Zixibacteria bacterium RBG_16_43_9]|nr:MAG: hypothetical protein A2W07_04250 [candidate division Zixibacteria bacterium RBG_16_43_9]
MFAPGHLGILLNSNGRSGCPNYDGTARQIRESGSLRNPTYFSDSMWVIEETPPRAGLNKWLPNKYSNYAPYRYNHILGVPDIPGDANSDGIVSVGDVVWLINYLFKGGPAPNPCWKADVNADCRVTIADVVYLVSYLFKGGPPPKYGCAISC